jgi:hypothetical protein
MQQTYCMSLQSFIHVSPAAEVYLSNAGPFQTPANHVPYSCSVYHLLLHRIAAQQHTFRSLVLQVQVPYAHLLVHGLRTWPMQAAVLMLRLNPG